MFSTIAPLPHVWPQRRIRIVAAHWRILALSVFFATACEQDGAGPATTGASTGEAAVQVAPEPPRQDAPSEEREEPVSACLVQQEQRIPANRLKALGTEPFWAARIEGRCVTYSTPEDQDGTRIWTRFSGSAEAGEWRGYLENQPFILRTRPQADCSDGMSDNRYPIAVTLTVRGEERPGCAERL